MYNINPETNIRYGVTNGRNCTALQDDIVVHGENESYNGWVADETERFVDALREANLDKSEDELKAAAHDAVLEMDWEGDECTYSYEDKDGNKFRMSYLGGAPLIWCCQTDTKVYARRLCSPCVPNAADLDSGLVGPEGHLCYGVPKQYLDEGDDDADSS